MNHNENVISSYYGLADPKQRPHMLSDHGEERGD
jgi:hypothetical protein